jgi:hypothetical protein
LINNKSHNRDCHVNARLCSFLTKQQFVDLGESLVKNVYCYHVF